MTPEYQQSPPSTHHPGNSNLTNTPTAPETPSDVQAWAESLEEPKLSPSPQSRVQSLGLGLQVCQALGRGFRPWLRLACIYQYIYLFFFTIFGDKK